MGGPFFCKKKRLRQRSQQFRASRNLGAIFLKKKKRLRQHTHKSQASKNMGAMFLNKKSACGNVVSRSGLPKNPKIENSQNQNPFCPKCRQYFFKPEKEPPGPIWGHPGPFFAWAGKSKNFAYFPWWALAAIHPRWGYW